MHNVQVLVNVFLGKTLNYDNELLYSGVNVYRKCVLTSKLYIVQFVLRGNLMASDWTMD